MAKTASLVFNGGVIPTGGGASSNRVIHHLFLRELTITELGQEVSVYALLDLDRPTLVAPNYEPVSAFTLFDWCSRGDVLQVDVAEALETGTNTYSAFFESATVATSSNGSYVDECIIRVDTKLPGTTPKINTRYLHLSQILDESTSIAYMCQHTSLNDHVTYGGELRRTGKVHFLKAVSDYLAQEKAPYSFWIVDLEKPNPQSPYGYDYAMADEIIAKLSAGEVFVLSTYSTAPSSEEDLFIMSRAQDQSKEGHPAVRIWFTRMFANGSPEYMDFTSIYTPSMYNGDNDPLTGGQPEGRMAILNWRGEHDSLSKFRFMEYTELAAVATTGSYEDLTDKPTIPEAQVRRGLNTSQASSRAYSLVGTLSVTDSNHRGMMAFELFCCKRCANPIRMHGTFGYQTDDNLSASYGIESSIPSELSRYKLAWRFADDHTTDVPKIEIWLIDTIETGTDQRRCGCFVHMVAGIEWADGNLTTDTLPSNLHDFTPFYIQPKGV